MRRRVLVPALLAAVWCVLLAVGEVRAEGEVPTEVEIVPVPRAVVGERVEVEVRLRLAAGGAIIDEPVSLSLDGVHVRRTRTDEAGAVRIRLPVDLGPGTYAITATYSGLRGAYLASRAQATVEITAFQLEVETVPPLPGVTFALDGERFVTGDDGIARIAVGTTGQHELEVLDAEYAGPDARVEFSRWNTELFGPRISVKIPLDRPLQAGFDVYHRASLTFVDLDGGPVNPERVSEITIRSSLGNVFTFEDGASRWFKASRAVRRPNGLESVDVRYNVEAVTVDGSNVVNAGQQRFLVAPDDAWEISLLLYSAVITPMDALFGFRAGDAVEVLYPDERVVRVAADEDGELALHWLARGLYRMSVADAPGWSPVVPVALSRDQQVELRVVTYLDMAVALAAAMGLAVGLVHVGRPHLIPGAVGSAWRRAATVAALPRAAAGLAARPRARRRRLAEHAARATALLDAARGAGIRPVAAPDAALAYPPPVTAAGGTIAAVAPRRRTATAIAMPPPAARRRGRSARAKAAPAAAALPAPAPQPAPPGSTGARDHSTGTAAVSRRPKRSAAAIASSAPRASRANTTPKPRSSAPTNRTRRQTSAVTASIDRRGTDLLVDAIDRVLQRRGGPMARSVVDQAAQRRIQLRSLGLADPAEADAREPGGRTSGGPATAAHVPGWTVADGAPTCERCGLGLWAGSRFCRRCGRLHTGLPAMLSLVWSQDGGRLGHHPGPDDPVVGSMTRLRRARRSARSEVAR